MDEARSWERAGISSIVGYCEDCLESYGPTHQGVGWPNAKTLNTRFAVMLALMENGPSRPRVLDLGCGAGLLLGYLAERGKSDSIDYLGIDISGKMIDAARARWPDESFEFRDIIDDPLPLRDVDYVIMNGVLTAKMSLSYDEMADFARCLIVAAFAAARIGIAYNVMGSHVDWRHDHVFQWPFDEAAAFLASEVSRNYSFRADYGLLEYTTYVFREAHDVELSD